MERVTLRVPEEQVEQVEALVEAGDYPNRSEAIRAGIRQLVGAEPPAHVRQQQNRTGRGRSSNGRGES